MTELDRAQGCLMGQFCGDALGSLVEFQTPQEIKAAYPDGVRLLSDGGAWNTIAGQPTDDSEMALCLARSLVREGTYSSDAVRRAYVGWLNSAPFDCGRTVASALTGHPISDSQANGAMMRVSPLGVFGAKYPSETVGKWAWQDAALTHPNPVCLQANALFVMALRQAIITGCNPTEVYAHVRQWAADMGAEAPLMAAVEEAACSPPAGYLRQQGWVLIAFQNALWQLLHAPSFEDSVVDTIMRGGDTDTNAAICGALLGAIYGVEAIPKQWRDAVLSCRPMAGVVGVVHPRPECYWPIDALDLAKMLLNN